MAAKRRKKTGKAVPVSLADDSAAGCSAENYDGRQQSITPDRRKTPNAISHAPQRKIEDQPATCSLTMDIAKPTSSRTKPQSRAPSAGRRSVTPAISTPDFRETPNVTSGAPKRKIEDQPATSSLTVDIAKPTSSRIKPQARAPSAGRRSVTPAIFTPDFRETPNVTSGAPKRKIEDQPATSSLTVDIAKLTSTRTKPQARAPSAGRRSVTPAISGAIRSLTKTICRPKSPTRAKPEPDQPLSGGRKVPKSEEDPQTSIFLPEASPILDSYSRRLSSSQIIQLLHHIKQLIPASQRPSLQGLRPQLSNHAFYAFGFSPASWLSLVQQNCPIILANDTSHMKTLPMIDHNQMAKALLVGSEFMSLKTSSRYIVKIVRELNKPPKNLHTLSHIIVAAFHYSATHDQSCPTSNPLNDYVDFEFIETFFEALKAVITAIVELKKPNPQLGKMDLRPLALCLSFGIRGLMIPRISSLECNSVASAQLIHMLKLSSDQGIKLPEETVWIKTQAWFYNHLHALLTSNGDQCFPTLGQLADHIVADFITSWIPSGRPIPWLYPRRAKNAPPPKISVSNILSHVDF